MTYETKYIITLSTEIAGCSLLAPALNVKCVCSLRITSSSF